VDQEIEQIINKQLHNDISDDEYDNEEVHERNMTEEEY
jgi:hypothetical protein